MLKYSEYTPTHTRHTWWNDESNMSEPNIERKFFFCLSKCIVAATLIFNQRIFQGYENTWLTRAYGLPNRKKIIFFFNCLLICHVVIMLCTPDSAIHKKRYWLMICVRNRNFVDLLVYFCHPSKNRVCVHWNVYDVRPI